ncbi:MULTISPECIES: hypothetical protein [Burkholderia]|uniref:hypothetical protein n=1 Tax=Burkholderia TaxID=32008 RepID=UPI00034CBD43|nr:MULTISPECIES: hypothetical protein [Burkholderia]PNW97323.1 hypothetical protein CF649_28000 [Burkholderia sp. 136(2017)]PNX34519.1 hypothetical protein CF648_28005 [Burkholderia sp. 137]
MSLNHPKIPRLPSLDFTSDETRTFYAVEWINEKDEWSIDTHYQETSRDTKALQLFANGAKSVLIYDVIGPFNAGLDEAENFAFDNRRLHVSSSS